MSKQSVEEKRAHEKALISEMIRLYCKKNTVRPTAFVMIAKRFVIMRLRVLNIVP